MTLADRLLLSHLASAVIVKVIVLTLLWWLFVHEARVSADRDQTAAHLGVATHAQGASR